MLYVFSVSDRTTLVQTKDAGKVQVSYLFILCVCLCVCMPVHACVHVCVCVSRHKRKPEKGIRTLGAEL